ncbi:cytochrome c551 [Lysinibacillus sp. NPDC098008]|uniref:cytochrome c551 n=1 Tax=Lysinibacillus sp. NPDC098008 TaxID=3364146 RepID=UPI0037FE6B25
MKKAMLTLVFGSAIFLAACGGGDDNGTKDNEGATAPDGEAIAMKSCVSCHGGELQGASGPALNDVGSRLSESEILDIINNGQNGMPPGIVKGEDAEAVAKWLATQK